MLTEELTKKCEKHPNPFDCPDALIFYSEKFEEYGLIVHDGGASYVKISFCPWCGGRLPDSKRDLWLDELERLGFDDPFNEDIPKRYQTGE